MQKTVFGTQEEVEVGRLYGSLEEGTARKLYQPSMIHPRVHFSQEAIGNAVEWMQMTLDGGNNLPPSDQTWYWKEFFTFVALIGMVFFLLAVGRFLLQTDYFKELREDPAPPKSIQGGWWWIGAVIMVLLPLPVYWWAYKYHYGSQGLAKASFIWPEQITNVIIFWALAVGLIALILFLLWHFLLNKKTGATGSDYGLTWKDKGLSWKKIGKSFLLALIVIFFAHLSLAVSDWLFKTDYRLWVFAIKPLDSFRFYITLGYIIPFTIYFLILGIVLHGQMRPEKPGAPLGRGREMIIKKDRVSAI